MNKNIKLLIESFIDDENDIIDIDLNLENNTLSKHISKVLSKQEKPDIDFIIEQYESGYKHTVHTKEEIILIVSNIKMNQYNWLDTSLITDMSGLFYWCESFNSDISEWDVSNVTNMSKMFETAVTFNKPIGKWDVSNVLDMSNMFYEARSFNLDISKWNVSSVKNMKNMFQGAVSFNLNIGEWDVSNVVNMNGMFFYAKSFNLDINSWDVKNVNNMAFMFKYSGLEKNKPIWYHE